MKNGTYNGNRDSVGIFRGFAGFLKYGVPFWSPHQEDDSR